MTRTISAIFDAGVFRPLEPVELADGTQVELQLQLASDTSCDPGDENSKKAWLDYLERMESLPARPASDGLSNRDHDQIIYGG
jgi:predicted DNA-binding antitoxin AbrB/MazE fold protein